MHQDFQQSHQAQLERFYTLFESMYQYIKDFLTFIDELEEGTDAQLRSHSGLSWWCRLVHPVLRRRDAGGRGRQAAGNNAPLYCTVDPDYWCWCEEVLVQVCEAIYLYGVMLLLMEMKIPGTSLRCPLHR